MSEPAHQRCSETMQQIFRIILMPKYDSNKVAKQCYWNRPSAWGSLENLLYIFRAPIDVSKVDVSKVITALAVTMKHYLAPDSALHSAPYSAPYSKI